MVLRRKSRSKERFCHLILNFQHVQHGHGTGQVTRVTNTILGRMQSSSICPACGGSGQTIISRGSGADSNGMLNSEETVSIKNSPWS